MTSQRSLLAVPSMEESPIAEDTKKKLHSGDAKGQGQKLVALVVYTYILHDGRPLNTKTG